MTTPSYSIILPVRNGGQYIKECVGSILSQSFTEFDLLILDNCSTDGTREWLDTLTDSRIIIYPAERPLTIEENWGRITSIPKNEFITLIGHDDILDKNYLETMDRLVSQHPHASLYQAHFRYIDSKGDTIRPCLPMDSVQSAKEFLSFFLRNLIDTMGTGFMMRSVDYDALGGIPPYPNLLFADFELFIGLTRKGYKATAFEECFAFRLHQSMTTTSSDLKFQQAFGEFMRYLAKLQTADPALQEVIRRYVLFFIRFYCKGMSHRLLRASLKKREGKTVDQLLTECKGYANALIPGNDYDPGQPFSIRLAKWVDSTWVTRELFRLFKKIYSKPLYT